MVRLLSKDARRKYGVAVLCATCLTTLLVLGRVPQAQVAVSVLVQDGSVSVTAVRGGTISTGGSARLLLSLGDATVGFYENTDVVLEDLHPGALKLMLKRGRIAVSAKSPIEVATPWASAVGEGYFSVVHYDFLEKVDFLQINGSVKELRDPDDYGSVNEVFDPGGSLVHSFYEWFETGAGLQIE